MTKVWNFCSPRNLGAIVLTAFFVISAGAIARAQTTGAGSINGTVMDPNGAVVPGATVTIRDVDTNVSHSSTTDSAGIYAAPFLLPGHYEIDAMAATFGKVQEKGITLLVGETLTINLTLKVSGATTTVEVSSMNEILDTEKTEVSQVMDNELVANMPVNARNWSDFVLLTPNVTQDGTSGLISFHGISGLYNQNYVDGANNNEMLFSEARGRASGAPYVYSLDSIKEFQAETSNYSVEFGQAAGGQVNAITKSGTNNMHGDLFYNLRYPTLNALDPLAKWNALYGSASSNPLLAATLLTQPIHQQNQFGGSVGGPIKGDRLFYFFTYDGFRRVGRALYYNTNTISLTPTAATSAGTIISPTQCPTTVTSTHVHCRHPVPHQRGRGCSVPLRQGEPVLPAPGLSHQREERCFHRLQLGRLQFYQRLHFDADHLATARRPPTVRPSYHERFLVGGLTTTINNR